MGTELKESPLRKPRAAKLMICRLADDAGFPGVTIYACRLLVYINNSLIRPDYTTFRMLLPARL